MGHDTRSPARSQGELAALLPWARRYLFRLGASQDEVDDVAQEALLIALRCWGVYDPRRGSLRAWLSGILKNEWRAHRRRVRSRREVPLGAEDECHAHPSHEGAIIARSTLEFLAREVPSDLLRPVIRRASGETGREVAEHEGVCPATGYDRVHRGRLDLAAALARENAAVAGPMVRRRSKS